MSKGDMWWSPSQAVGGVRRARAPAPLNSVVGWKTQSSSLHVAGVRRASTTLESPLRGVFRVGGGLQKNTARVCWLWMVGWAGRLDGTCESLE